jgi:hypothetical protein
MSDEATEPPEFVEKAVPLWQKAAAVAYVVVIVLAAIVFRDRLHADFIPLDGSRVAPNVLATVLQILAATPFVVLLWPPTRRRVHRFVSRHTAPLHAHLMKAEAQRDRLHAEHLAAQAETQRRLNHIIRHSTDIPPLPPKRSRP